MSNLAYQMFVGAFLQSSSGVADTALLDDRYSDLLWSATTLITPDMDVTNFVVGPSTMTTREKNTVFDLDLYGRVEAGPLTSGDITVSFERPVDMASFFAQTQAITDVDQPQLILFKAGKLKSVTDSARIYDVFYTQAALLTTGDGFNATAKEVLTSEVTFKASGKPTLGVAVNNQTITWNPLTKTATIN